VVKMDGAVTEPSPMARAAEEEANGGNGEGVDRPRRMRRDDLGDDEMMAE